MRASYVSSLAFVALCGVCGSVEAQAPAQPAVGPAPTASYDDLVRLGQAALVGSDWDNCVKYFEQAHALQPSEMTYLAIGRCALERGDYVKALRHLQLGMRYSLNDRQRVSAENLAERARQHVGRYRVVLQPAGAALQIGNQVVLPDADGYVWLTVGRYPVSVSAPGYETMSGDVLVQAGDDGVLSYALMPMEAQLPVVMGRVGAPPPQEKKFPVVPVVVASIGGALLVGSIVTGVLALNDKSKLDDRCVLGPMQNLCDRNLVGTRDGAKTLSIVTDVLWITGVAAVGTAVLLYLLQPGAEESSVQVGAAALHHGGELVLSGRM